MRHDIRETIQMVMGSPPVEFSNLHGGCVSEVKRVDLADGERVVIKLGDESTGLMQEAHRLRYLAQYTNLPVPEVLHADADVLIINFIETAGGITGDVQTHAAELLADLHGISSEAYGFDQGSLSGGLLKPAPWTDSWIEFYREHRLRHTMQAAVDSGQLPRDFVPRLERLMDRLDEWLFEPEQPALIHGDMWTGNVLCNNGKVAAFVDPSCYFAHDEQELAYSTLFGTFGKPFFVRYHEIRPIKQGFFDERVHLYNLYHLLIHVRLFGGSYVQATSDTLDHYGC